MNKYYLLGAKTLVLLILEYLYGAVPNLAELLLKEAVQLYFLGRGRILRRILRFILNNLNILTY